MYLKFKHSVKKLVPKSFRKTLANNLHWLESLNANIVTGFPARKLKIIGVTGTSGKSTTTAMIAHIFNVNGLKTAYFTTTNAFWGGEEHDNVSTLTTETPLTLYKRIETVHGAGDEFLIIESSAHAIVQHRLAFIPYRGAVFTNLSHDHLDYFGDMQTYANAKQELFTMVAKQVGYGVFKADDVYTKQMSEPIDAEKRLTFGFDSGDITAHNLREENGSVIFTVTYQKESHTVCMPLIGRHNVLNALAAVSTALQEGIELKKAVEALESFSGVRGRMERLVSHNGARILIDFAHTPEAFELILSDLHESKQGRLIAVFGGYGDRDPTIRGPFGEIAAKYCDDIILTEDTVGSETVAGINQDIIAGIESVSTYKGSYTEIEAREEAILEALKRAGPGDTVALLGKGHEREIKRYPENKPWNEIEATKKAIATLGKDKDAGR